MRTVTYGDCYVKRKTLRLLADLFSAAMLAHDNARRYLCSADRSLASDFGKRDASSCNVLQRRCESLRICSTTLIEPERLLVEIPEEMERLDANVRALDRALEQRPIVFTHI